MKENGYTKDDIKLQKQQKIGTNIICSLVCAQECPRYSDYDKFLETLPGVIGGQSNAGEWVREKIDEVIIIGKEKLKKKDLKHNKKLSMLVVH